MVIESAVNCDCIVVNDPGKIFSLPVDPKKLAAAIKGDHI
jgi:hypothetical protein